jgi:hypothetical protein
MVTKWAYGPSAALDRATVLNDLLSAQQGLPVVVMNEGLGALQQATAEQAARAGSVPPKAGIRTSDIGSFSLAPTTPAVRCLAVKA